MFSCQYGLSWIHYSMYWFGILIWRVTFCYRSSNCLLSHLGIIHPFWGSSTRVPHTEAVQERGENVETTLGLHLLGENLHWRVEDDSLERHWCGKHGHGVQEILKSKNKNLLFFSCIAMEVKTIQTTPTFVTILCVARSIQRKNKYFSLFGG